MGKKPADSEKLSVQQYDLLQRAFDHFNGELFGGELPQVIMTLHRHRGALGYFRPECFTLRADAEKSVHEIALNPDYFRAAIPTTRSLSTLVHEMVHLWQAEFGKRKPKRAYHNREWAGKMEDVGLVPSTTGAEGGKRTGQKCSHFIAKGGRFEHSAANFLAATHDAFLFNAKPNELQLKKVDKNKVCYECETCLQKAWAKPEANLICGNCKESMPPQRKELILIVRYQGESYASIPFPPGPDRTSPHREKGFGHG